MDTTNNVNKKKTIYVGGLEESVTVDIITAAFIPFGDIVDIILPNDHKNHRNKGYCFVEYESSEDAADAVDNMNESELYGKTLKCVIAKPNTIDKNKSLWSNEKYLTEQNDELDKQKEFIEEKLKEVAQ
ncbi:hypothetical protein DFA_03689 [Cavenderia fasciculata]|uniref:RRM domain-containing protein n=1 Tax=Cavenderia fasciculata TaxID=261658 RepID=F4Q1Q2_CACFS|nr:uncharacterized protein DFA_03689 [Cavenderia fasciculata]EGG18202.1 hypothetical protein DFA_03689 [Cavenderia fasciculata]|eukprot:XP_004357025.1 hypothetical protein DFA_03689 [Cavenderia fasciculata]